MKNITTIHRRKTPDSFKLLPKVSRKTRKAIYLEASKYINDLTKLIFGGIILTNILNFGNYISLYSEVPVYLFAN